MLDWIRRQIGTLIAQYVTKERDGTPLYTDSSPAQMLAVMRPGDVLLVEGTSRASTAIKYLTQSTWSHSAVFVGSTLTSGSMAGRPALIEADTVEGVIAVPIDKYARFNTRICRPVNLSDADRDTVLAFLTGQLGLRYDMKHIFDLMRYLLPVAPVPSRLRRRLIAFGSGDPTRAICSSLIAQAFQLVRYPILPQRFCGLEDHQCEPERPSDSVLLAQRHFSHFTPRDFDASPYFEVVKPRIVRGFDYREMRWADRNERIAGTPHQPHTASD